MHEPGDLSFPQVGAVDSVRTWSRPAAGTPGPVARVGGHLHYYRYCVDGTWHWREPAMLLARWQRVTRRIPDDGSCRPVWLAMKLAAAAGQIELFGSQLDDA